MTKPKNVTLRAFKINQSNKLNTSMNVFSTLKEKLEQSIKSSERCLVLSQDDPNNEKDLISNYHETGNPQSFFCTMLRIIPGEDAQHIPSTLLEKNKFSMDDVEKLQSEKNIPDICKENYFFVIDNNHLVTNLRGNKTIKDLQTYLAWLLDNDLFELTPMINIPKDIPLQDIKNVSFNDSYSRSIVSDNSDSVKTKSFNMKDIAQDWLKNILGGTKSLDDMDLDRIIEANLIVKWSKPKDMSKEEYEKMMGAVIKPISDLNGIVIQPKKGSAIKGQDIPKKKIITVSVTSSGKIIEEALKQEMSKFLNELKND
ncbi:hypothetical protein [Wohlfahrtiimonas larvae]|uniref:Recombination-associated protein RdgC n=1 Tax=Wohlfahrtiimonas larvae TaxID=1157986 RepID=A0ABP9MXU2_9GAMM|nr:hypothetical protein [Wohlfahrtiimonas larvae]